MFAICYRPSVYLYCLSSVTFVHRTPYSGDWNFRQCLSDPWWYLQTPCVSADFFLSVEDFFLSYTPGHLCISPVCSEYLICYVLLKMNSFFPLCYGFFHVCHGLRPCSSLSDPWWYLQTPCVSANFFVSITDFLLSFTPEHLCITPVQYV